MIKTILLLLLTFFLSFESIEAQTRTELEQQRKQLLQEISSTNNALSKTRKSKANALSSYMTLKDQIAKRQELIDTYEQEIELGQQNIERTNQVVTALQTDLGKLNEEYKQIMQAALKNKLQQSYLVFLFSSNSLNDAFRRWQYLRQYDKYRQNQTQLIFSTQESLLRKSALLTEEQEKKEQLLLELSEQNDALSKELLSKDRLLSNLKSEEKKLLGSLNQKEKAAKKLKQLIENIIKAAIAAEKKSNDNNNESNVEVVTSGNFVSARGRLPWPVPNGKISKPYGINYHPKFKNVKITNNGIDIHTAAGSTVKAVFKGKVAGVQFIPGFKNTVIIKHGKYYTVYSNLASIYVKRGDSIQAQQDIGKVGNTEPEIHFEIWRQKERLDPSKWILKK